MRLVALVFLIVALCGCATKPLVISDSSRFAAEGSAFEGRATAYVIRDLEDAPGIHWPTHAMLDGVEKGVLFRGSYTRFAVAPGRHVVVAHWNRALSSIPEVAVDSDFETGKTYYFVVSNDIPVGVGWIEFQSFLRLADPRAGARMVRRFDDRTPAAAKQR